MWRLWCWVVLHPFLQYFNLLVHLCMHLFWQIFSCPFTLHATSLLTLSVLFKLVVDDILNCIFNIFSETITLQLWFAFKCKAPPLYSQKRADWLWTRRENPWKRCCNRNGFKPHSSRRGILLSIEGVVGWCESVMYLMSQGRPADIGLQLGKACYPCSR